MSEILKRTALAAAQRRNETIADPDALSARITKVGLLNEYAALLSDADVDVVLTVMQRLARAREA